MERRLRGQRISREELIEESRKTLEEAGVANNARAKFIKEVSKEVVGSRDPLYAQLQPKIIQHDSQAWIKAFALMFQYLNDNNLTETVSTIEVEFGQGPLPDEILEDQGVDSDKEFNDLLAGIPKKTTFRVRVKEYFDRIERSKPQPKPKVHPKRKTPKKTLSETKTRSSTKKSTPKRSVQKREQIQEELEFDARRGVTPKKGFSSPTIVRGLSPKKENSLVKGRYSQLDGDEEAKRTVTKRPVQLKKRKTRPAPARPKKLPPPIIVPPQKEKHLLEKSYELENEGSYEELQDDFVIDVVIPASH